MSNTLTGIAADLLRFAGNTDWEFCDGEPADLVGWASRLESLASQPATVGEVWVEVPHDADRYAVFAKEPPFGMAGCKVVRVPVHGVPAPGAVERSECRGEIEPGHAWPLCTECYRAPDPDCDDWESKYQAARAKVRRLDVDLKAARAEAVCAQTDWHGERESKKPLIHFAKDTKRRLDVAQATVKRLKDGIGVVNGQLDGRYFAEAIDSIRSLLDDSATAEMCRGCAGCHDHICPQDRHPCCERGCKPTPPASDKTPLPDCTCGHLWAHHRNGGGDCQSMDGCDCMEYTEPVSNTRSAKSIEYARDAWNAEQNAIEPDYMGILDHILDYLETQ